MIHTTVYLNKKDLGGARALDRLQHLSQKVSKRKLYPYILSTFLTTLLLLDIRKRRDGVEKKT